LARQVLVYAAELRDSQEQLHQAQTEVAALRHALALAETQELSYAGDLQQMYGAERTRREELEDAYVATIRGFAAAIEARDDYTGGHVERVRAYSEAIGARLQFSAAALKSLSISALLHDLGKIGTPDTVLTKPGPLNAAEWVLLKQHCMVGAGILRGIPFLSGHSAALAQHHERWDGAGYPAGLRGEAICMEARIIAVSDTFDAMTSTRAYHRAGSIGAAVAEISAGSGAQFAPNVVAAFLEAWQDRAIP